MVKDIFRRQYGAEADLAVQSPGRINLIGEHTDYNEGFVLPAAIDKYVQVAVGKRDDDIISLFALQFDQRFEVRTADISPLKGKWTNYVLGVVDQLIKAGHTPGGFNMVIDGNVPAGAGLSSSAAIECAVCYALNELFGFGLQRFEIVRLSQMAEHTYAGVKCGIMDQFASVFGKKDHALRLDCRTLDYEEVPLQMEGYKIVLLNTNVKHSLASSEYNTRRRECADGVAMVGRYNEGVHSLRDITRAMLDEHVKDPLIHQRCRFVIEENARVQEAIQQLRSGNIMGLGQQMYGSHYGLSREYEVSCPELDYLVEAVRNNPAVAGARMMGGGFGGCTINIVKEEAIEELINTVGEAYARDMKKEMTAYVAVTSDGTSLIRETSVV